jgi:(E)-4-hydroxy-3-methylbut-2-enyl-diphosphate synthase
VEKLSAASFFPVGYNYSVPTDKWNLSDQACDYIYTGNRNIDFEIPGTLGIIVDASAWKEKDRCYPLFSLDGFLAAENKSKQLNFVSVQADGIAELGKHNQVLKDSNVVLLCPPPMNMRCPHCVKHLFC